MQQPASTNPPVAAPTSNPSAPAETPAAPAEAPAQAPWVYMKIIFFTYFLSCFWDIFIPYALELLIRVPF